MLTTKLKYGILLSSVISTSVFATEQHNISLGYAVAPQVVLNDFHRKEIKNETKLNKLNGINLQYRYETESPWGAVVSSTYLKGKEKNAKISSTVQGNVATKQFSLLAGPSYRFNKYISTYALAGVANPKVSYNYYDSSHNTSGKTDISKKAFAYGVGVAINPISNMSVHVGYEGNKYIKGFNVGVGYRF
ncbi:MULTISPECIES: Ail/Lom family outer membrane beta-barrel protein [unclassified Acinetobacter]|uniref:Ail/Lom family outer membrane beta-barrel protein n=1 Tax=unclassified Acinetobacter TaxID=196816 RepID=UPI0029346F95|nr:MULTISPECIES: Ail/Lom family outer membrane beta-barrel protein [unclassified Acinetobacter]WOE32574.1 Ail/Lom family outer membrane beta-barrel protein [Acinetobacter sp. SAAs470]WOE38049.1 Ail/Lom family outer membrane beta-barrel protein [Acinetobacter sp. SAAs474]